MIFLVIGRTAEIVQAGGLAIPSPDVLTGADFSANLTAAGQVGTQLIKRAEISTSLVNAGTAISELVKPISLF